MHLVSYQIYQSGFISMREIIIMRIKYSSFKDHNHDCPEEKLKSISCTEELMRHRPLLPVTPDRKKKDVWIMDPWENTIDQTFKSPEEQRVLNKHVQNYSCKKFASKKGEFSIDRSEENPKYCTPQTIKNDCNGGEKENKYRFRMFLQARTQKQMKFDQNEEICTFKKPIQSIVYPVIKDKLKEKNRRIDRFHSFVARNIRK